MPTIVQCPACGRKLRVPDELLGKLVKCPGCGGTFTGADKTSAPASEPQSETPSAPSRIAALDDLHLEIEDEPAPPPLPPSPPPAPRPRQEEIVRPQPTPEPRPKPAAKPKPKRREEDVDDGKEPCPYCGERIKRDSIRCKYCGEELEENEREEDEIERPSRRGRRRNRGIRRDALPHRGGIVLTLGIISVVSVAFDVLLFCCCMPASWVTAIVGLGTGIPAWVMGQRDLAKMRTGEMDPSGKGSTQGGWICGLIGTILSVLILVGSVIVFIIYGAAIMSGALMNPGAPGNPGPFGPQPGPGRRLSIDPGTIRLWHYLPSGTVTTLPKFPSL
jgi:hypothetical protein